MGLKFERKKSRNYINSVIYKLSKIKFASDRGKFKLYSDLEWIFSRLAHEYSVKILDKDLHPMKKGLYDFLQEKISLADTILDLGCGYGEISCKLSEGCKTVIGIDHDPAKIQRAKESCKNENVTFICGDALEFLQSNSQVYNVMICSHVLEHLDDPESLLEDYKKYFSFI